MTTLIIMIFVVGYLCIVMETSEICWRIVQARVVASLSLVQRQVVSSWGWNASASSAIFATSLCLLS